MKIAIVAPSPIPFVVGGAEKLWWGLYNYLQSQTPHQVELIKIPIKEDTPKNIISAYYKFFKLDLSHFDMIISTKYPAFMVQHPNHYLYLQHLLRGLYDTYPEHLPQEIKTNNITIYKFLSKIKSPEISLDDIFETLFELYDRYEDEPELNTLPGYFIRDVVYLLDRRAMENIKFFSAISNTVKNRANYFPPLADIKVIYHPTTLKCISSNRYDYFFTASRLDKPKRIDMIIRSFVNAKVDDDLLIAGTGPEEANLKKLSKSNKNIKFLGFVSDETLRELYSNAKAVLYTPKEEDYGLITIEALSSNKPVITCNDSGGVNEFIVDGENGFVVPPDENCISEAIKNVDSLLEKRSNFNDRVNSITWENLFNDLMNRKRKKILALSTYSIYPPSSGGKIRCYNILKRLSSKYDIIVLSLYHGHSIEYVDINVNFKEIRIPLEEKFINKLHILEKELEISALDIAAMIHYKELTTLSDLLNEKIDSQDFIYLCQPFLFPIVQDFNKPIIYDSHNVEFLLKEQIVAYKDHPSLSKLKEIEYQAIDRSLFTISCSEEDIDCYLNTYNINRDKIHLVPNGLDTKRYLYVPYEQKLAYKKHLKLQNNKIAIFIGSDHKPNNDASLEILKYAQSLPSYSFILIGSTFNSLLKSGIRIPNNLRGTNHISDLEKKLFFAIGDIALNPINSGSGSNLKIAEYLISGLPTISTAFGTRGYKKDIYKHLIVSDINDFPMNIEKLFENLEHYDTLMGYNYIKNNYDWDLLVKNIPLF